MLQPAALVVAYGAPELLEKSLASVRDVGQLIVVDNSRSADVRAVAERHAADYVDPGRNAGFAAGVNIGLGRIDPGRDILLLNPDAVLPDQAVPVLQEELHRQPGIAAVAPMLRYADGSLQRPSWPFPSPLGVWLDALGLGRFRRSARFLVGAVLMLRSDAVDAIGRFDERFFLYAEEADWQLRALRAGWTVQLVERVTAIHIGGGTSSDPWRRTVLFHRSGMAFARKWYGRSGYVVIWSGSVIGAALRSLLRRGPRAAEARRMLRLLITRPGGNEAGPGDA